MITGLRWRCVGVTPAGPQIDLDQVQVQYDYVYGLFIITKK
jgi:hypothetical protein